MVNHSFCYLLCIFGYLELSLLFYFPLNLGFKSYKLLGFQGMNLYFKRLDGQVVICEDFFVAMRDANDAYYVTFLLLFVFFPSNSLHFFYSFCINLSTTM